MTKNTKKNTSLTLSCWRELRPNELRPRSMDLLELIAPLTQLGQDDLQRQVALMVSLGQADAAVALQVAQHLSRTRAEQRNSSSAARQDTGLAMCWLVVAASSDGRGTRNSPAAGLAARLIAWRLLWLAKRHRFYDTPDQDRELAALAGEWLNADPVIDWSFSVLIDEVWKTSRRPEAPSRRTDGKPATDRAKALPTPSSPELVVLKGEIITGKSSDDKAFAASWSELANPLRLLGGDADPDLLGRVLLAEFPWAEAIVKALVSDLRFRRDAGKAWARIRPTLLVGPPGTGKTRLVKRFAELAALGYGELSVAGSSDSRSLAGTARGWSTANPSFALHVMRQEKTANPVIVVDELDKAGGSERNGDIRHTLLAMIEPVTAKRWPDEALQVPVDLSQISWLATANQVERLRGPLLSRFRVVEIGRPTADDFDQVLGSILRDIANELDVAVSDLPALREEAVTILRTHFARGWPIRRIRNAVEGALQVSTGPQRQTH